MNSVMMRGMIDELVKISQETEIAQAQPEPEAKLEHPAWTAGKGALGLGAGLATGYLAAEGANRLSHAAGAGDIAPALRIGVPIAGMGAGAALSLGQEKMRGRIKKWLAKRKESQNVAESTGDTVSA